MMIQLAIGVTRRSAVAALFALAAARGDAQVTRGSNDPFANRHEWQRVAEILAALGAGEGKRIADIAAGDGFLTRPLAKRVGATGRVFAVEISREKLDALAALARSDSLANIEVIEGTASDPRLPDSLHAAVVLNSYHEFADYKGMLKAIGRALRPGGLLVLVDNTAGAGFFSARQEQADHHALDPKFVEAELREAGFEIAERQDRFIVRPVEQWMIVGRRPAR